MPGGRGDTATSTRIGAEPQEPDPAQGIAGVRGFEPSFPLVEAKLRPPARQAATFSRTRLTAALLAEPRSDVVAVVAPPGYGKTVLLADWATHENRDVAWLTLGEYDNEPSVFLTYLAAAIDRLQPIAPGIEATLATRGSRLLGTAVPRLASELHRLRGPAVLILDDAHRLVDRTCLDALAGLIELLPPGFQVAIGARTYPDLPFARLRAGQRLLEIGRADLAFDAAETRSLAAHAGYELAVDHAQALAERTEGWPAAIYLATLAHGRAGEGAAMTGEVSGRNVYIADYLRSELGSVMEDGDLTLLTRTSILEEFEPQLAEAVSSLADADARLLRLSGRNLLIGTVDAPEPVYRYHHLLRDYLQAELERREPGATQDLQGRAAAWYANAGRPELAIEHSIASGDLDSAATLIEAATLATYRSGHVDRLERWLGVLDEAAFERRPGLAMGAALVYALCGKAGLAERLGDIVDRSTFSGTLANGTASFESARAMLQAAMMRDGPDAAVANASFALHAEGTGSPWRSFAGDALALALMARGDNGDAETVLAEALDGTSPSAAHTFFIHALLASLAMARHDWTAATRSARESHDRFDRMKFDAVASSVLVHGVAARVAIHHGDLRRARAELVHAQLVRPLLSHALPGVAAVGLLEVARAYLAIADPAGAGSSLAEAEEILRRRPDLGVLAERVAELRQRSRGAAQALAGPSTLTPAELRVLPMLSTHLLLPDIAERLHVSRHTVKSQVVSIYGKLGASSRGDAVDRAIELGLLEPFPGLRLKAPRQPG
jgi:LuxR family transcriptional regulator, maltose regulon positive regulatory protein